MEHSRILKLLTVIACVICSAKSADDIVSLDSTNFEGKLSDLGKAWVVKFYSEMCGSCKEFEPTWSKVLSKIKAEFNVGKVNIDIKEGMEVARKYNILNEAGIPSIAVFRDKDLTKRTSTNVEGYSVNEVLNFIKAKEDI